MAAKGSRKVSKNFSGRGAATAQNMGFCTQNPIKAKFVEVEWFVKMVEERKQNNDHNKEKKNW